MSLDFATGGRADVAFSFSSGPYAGSAGVSAIDANGEAIVAVRIRSVRGGFGPNGTVGGQPVLVLGVERSPVEGYTRVMVRFLPCGGVEA